MYGNLGVTPGYTAVWFLTGTPNKDIDKIDRQYRARYM